jgi:hypothetical protein
LAEQPVGYFISKLTTLSLIVTTMHIHHPWFTLAVQEKLFCIKLEVKKLFRWEQRGSQLVAIKPDFLSVLTIINIYNFKSAQLLLD